ncbi:hypothetical protein ONR07_23880, partial [Salmonella enterica subsp. enterica serovar Anatum]|nr:hypothetical protein [Salmonella enterica subsp. enterica serovar Anatum]
MSQLDLNALNELPKVDRVMALAETNAQLEKLRALFLLIHRRPHPGDTGGWPDATNVLIHCVRLPTNVDRGRSGI